MSFKAVPKFGEVYYADLKAEGHLQSGVRPVLIAQNDTGNEFSPLINVIPLTSQTQKKALPIHVKIENSGLKYPSLALVEQMRPIPKELIFGNKIATLGFDVLQKIGKAIQIQYPFYYGV